MNNADGTRTLTQLHAKVSYTLVGGYLSAIRDRNNNTVTVNRDANSQITS